MRALARAVVAVVVACGSMPTTGLVLATDGDFYWKTRGHGRRGTLG